MILSGYVQIRELNSLAESGVEDAIRELEFRGVSMYVIDLRDNAGGLVNVRSSLGPLKNNSLVLLVNFSLLCNHSYDVTGGDEHSKPLLARRRGDCPDSGEGRCHLCPAGEDNVRQCVH